MKRIDQLIADQREHILTDERLRMTTAQWENLVKRLRDFLDKTEASIAEGKNRTEPECWDEQIWTFLVACGYAAGSAAGGLQKIAALLSGNADTPASPLWMEALPYPPRQKEGNTNLDLACGAINQRGSVGKSGDFGISYQPESDPTRDHIVFCEAKWYSDISTKVTHHRRRNQLARVIENALTFQNDDHQLAPRCTVTLITPAAFKTEPKSRLYHYKFADYLDDPKRLLAEFDSCDEAMPPRDTKTWRYPEAIGERLSGLRLHWVTFEELIEGLPGSELHEAITAFEERYNGSGRD